MKGFVPTILAITTGIVLSLSTVASAIPDWAFSLLPPSGSIAGPPGSTLGWGYTISNPDPTNWLSLTGLSADLFQNGIPFAIFDFPNVAPSEILSVPYDGINGLYQFTWDSTAPIAFINTGTFVLSADWFNADPFEGGIFLQSAPDRTAAYAVTVISAVPEPSTLLLLASGLLAVNFTRRKLTA